ncbi:putative nucleolar complex protein 14 [Podospora fimiseda]|uniref:Nucleolar complex protein 14 n=1 Tax=Podospora fimiseda TaxID=252190 RepID=A0AAN7BMR8_9PEZI|nr:putative nucleolar complex protein 14 [Podospora fimiseda]
MAGSQLKRLKASLKEQGIIGPQKSKKQKRQNAQDAKASTDKRVQRHEALASIREQFNPFQFKTSARGPKFEVTTNKPVTAKEAMGINGRPGITKAMGEERRRETLLVEMQQRNKVGGLIDRRFGENNPNMSLEDKMIERYTREQQRAHKKNSMFDLEDDDESKGGLTHMGRSLFDDDDNDVPMKDDFEGEELPSDEDDEDVRATQRALKRQRLEEVLDAAEELDEEQPQRKKTKKEIYEEIIAKSKLHKLERQEAKDEDTELRQELDKQLPELQRLLFSRNLPANKQDDKPQLLIAGKEKAAFDKDYDLEVKKLINDTRAAPTDRLKKEEEVAEEQANRLKELEEKRLKRMRGEPVSDDEDEEDEKKKKKKGGDDDEDFDMEDEDVNEFGLGEGIKYRPTATELGFDDEDDFLIDDDLVASGSELEFDSDDIEDGKESVEGESGSDQEEEDDDDDEFTKGLLTEAESKDSIFQMPTNTKGNDKDGIPFTFPCPQTYDEVVAVFKDIEVPKLPIAVQRIRALYHPKLGPQNKEKLGNFASALVRHLQYLGDRSEQSWLPALEAITRHIHSLAKSFPIEVAKSYRAVIQEMEQQRPLALTVGDLVTLTAVGTTFPTSDHFHQVVTPAMLVIARYLGQKIPQSLPDYATGTYLSILALQYQHFSKRYVPELMNFSLNTLCALSSTKPSSHLGFFPIHDPVPGIRLSKSSSSSEVSEIRKLTFQDCSQPSTPLTPSQSLSLKLSLLNTTLTLLKSASETWHKLSSFTETFSPALKVLQQLSFPSPLISPKISDLSTSLSRLLQIAKLSRRPLELHHHRPLQIKTYIPKFEDSFDPNKHYDPDRERAEMAKLKKEHKREKKGALRELRKDNAFMARENLRVKKIKDEAYHVWEKRTKAMIQGEAGQQANQYERERKARKNKR